MGVNKKSKPIPKGVSAAVMVRVYFVEYPDFLFVFAPFCLKQSVLVLVVESSPLSEMENYENCE